MSVQTFSKSGTKATTPVKLDKAVFSLDVTNHSLLKQAYLTHQANARLNLAVTKTRGLVRGGGKKPWRQKGTGRARFGSSRNPIWRGGGITFGPTGEENYTKSLNIKSKRLAIKQALSIAFKDNKIIVIEDIALKEAKTAELNKLLKKIGAERKTLIVLSEKSDHVIKASANLSNVKLIGAKYLSVFDILNADQIVFTNAALKESSTWLASVKGEKK